MIICRGLIAVWVASARITLPYCNFQSLRWGTHLVVGIVRQIGGAVEQITDSMPTVGPHNLEAL